VNQDLYHLHRQRAEVLKEAAATWLLHLNTLPTVEDPGIPSPQREFARKSAAECYRAAAISLEAAAGLQSGAISEKVAMFFPIPEPEPEPK
jgi:hypothetical protein